MPFIAGPTSTTPDFVPVGGGVFAQGTLIIANASAAVRLVHGAQGMGEPTDAAVLPPGTYPLSGTARDPVQGIEIADAVPGTHAVYVVALYEPERASILPGTQFAGTLTGTGGFTPPPVSASASARVHATANQALVSGVVAAIAFDAEDYDNDNIFDLAAFPTRATCKTAGVYAILGAIDFAINAAGARSAQLRLNGAVLIGATAVPASPTTDTNVPVATEYQLAVGDYVELLGYQDSGGGLNSFAAVPRAPVLAMSLQP